MKRSFTKTILSIALVILFGIGSRNLNIENTLINKYLGDVLYLILLFLIVSLIWKSTTLKVVLLSLSIVLCMEFFQLTLLPLHWSQSDNILLKIFSLLIGTKFSFLDILSYFIGAVMGVVIDLKFLKISDDK